MRDIERLLKDSLTEIGESYEPSDPVGAKQRFLAARKRRRFYAVGEFALAAGLTAIAFFAVTRAGIGTDEQVRVVTAAGPQVVAEIQEGGTPVAVAAGEGAVWITNGNEVRKLDPDTNEKLASVELQGEADEVITGDGYVWASDTRGNVYRIAPPSARVLDTYSFVEDPSRAVRLDLTVDAGQVWAAEPGSGRVFTVGDEDQNVETVFATSVSDVASSESDGVWAYSPDGELLPVAPDDAAPVSAPRGDANSDLAIGFGAAWIATGDDGVVHRIDLSSGETTNVAEVGGDFADLTIDVTGEGVWALAIHPAEGSSTLYELDPLTGAVASEPLELEGMAADVSAEGGLLWVPDKDGKVFKISSTTAEASPEPKDPNDAFLGADEIVLVFEREGDIWIRYPAREENVTDSPELESEPTVSPDGRYIVFERRADKVSEPEVVTLDMSTGRECCVRAGSEPAIGPYNQLAWALPPPTEAVAPIQEIAFSTLGEEETLSFPAADAAVLPGFSVTEIAWDQMGSSLLLEGGYEGTAVYRAVLQTEPTGEEAIERQVVNMEPAEIVLARDYEEGGGYRAPSTGADFAVLHTCCRMTDGDVESRFELGYLSAGKNSELEFRDIVGLPELSQGAGRGWVWTALVGEVWFEDGAFVVSDAIAYLVGDGTRQWLVRSPSGDVTELSLDRVGSAAAPNPFHAFQNEQD